MAPRSKPVPPIPDSDPAPLMPRWMTRAKAATPQDSAILAGAALAVLHGITTGDHPVLPLLRARLALRAAEQGLAIAGRPERAADLRDEVHLLRPGDQPGPAGQVFQAWLGAVRHKARGASGLSALPPALQDQTLLSPTDGTPLTQAAQVLERALPLAPRDETSALILTDTALARACGWSHPLPILSLGLRRADLRLEGDALHAACQRALVLAANDILPMHADLRRRTERLLAVAPKLRAKPAAIAVQRFLTCDALAPSLALRDIMSDRSARRLCDRLVELGALRELTGRDTFRLYGL